MTAAIRLDDDDVRGALAAVEEALAELEALPPPAARTAVEGIEAVVQVYSEALARMVDQVAADTPELGERLASDPLVGHLLLLHGLHPHPLGRRVADAVERARALAQRDGGDLELAEIDGGTVRITLHSGGGCTTSALQAMVEEVVLEMAPEVERVEIESSPIETVIPVEAIGRRQAGQVASG